LLYFSSSSNFVLLGRCKHIRKRLHENCCVETSDNPSNDEQWNSLVVNLQFSTIYSISYHGGRKFSFSLLVMYVYNVNVRQHNNRKMKSWGKNFLIFSSFSILLIRNEAKKEIFWFMSFDFDSCFSTFLENFLERKTKSCDSFKGC
jgi:hypothetical protein